jgi:hypothetical protein
LRGPRQQLAHFVIACLGKIFVILADRLEKFRHAYADDFICFILEFTASVWRADWHCYDNFRSAAVTQCLDCGAHGRPSCQTVINQNDNAIA